jgi:HSP20 family protein
MANITTTDPFVELARFDPFLDFDDLFGSRRLNALLRPMPEQPAIKLDVTESAESYRVKADIPGVRKEDIRVSVNANAVTISAEMKQEKEEKKGETVLRSERCYGKQSRSFTLRQEIEAGKAEAKYADGVLELNLPKKSATPVKELAIA